MVVRVVGDVDRRTQTGFQQLEDSNVEIVYGDGAISWQAVFGRELVNRTGEFNLMTHNFIIADRLRILNLTGGFSTDGDELTQAGFIAASEDLVKDFSDMFDQLHGGIFATSQTFYDDSVSADTNNRTSYPTEDSIVEVYFGPQERLVKEIIDRIYSAKASVYVASMNSRTMRLPARCATRALLGSMSVVLEKTDTPTEGLPEVRINTAIDGTWVIIDGRRAHERDALAVHGPVHATL